MPELRLNLISREWVIITREKDKNPEDFIVNQVVRRQPEFLTTCPFCPGNEAKATGEIASSRDENGWKVRVVWNKFSKLSAEGERSRHNTGVRKSVNGVGIHEVVIETPVHRHTTALMPSGQLGEVIRVYRDRFVEIYRDPRVEYVVIFKNNGPAAGTMIEHPLSQVVGMPITPLAVRQRIEGAMRFFDENGDCLVCRTIRDETGDGSRVIFKTEHFVSFIPYA
ncbi:MAG: galactose-1-phosphate uridylyltransferase, partial [Candidatus Dadabacteria bacterium]